MNNVEITYVSRYEKYVELAMLRGLTEINCAEQTKARYLYYNHLNRGLKAKEAAKITMMEMCPPKSALYQVAYDNYVKYV